MTINRLATAAQSIGSLIDMRPSPGELGNMDCFYPDLSKFKNDGSYTADQWMKDMGLGDVKLAEPGPPTKHTVDDERTFAGKFTCGGDCDVLLSLGRNIIKFLEQTSNDLRSGELSLKKYSPLVLATDGVGDEVIIYSERRGFKAPLPEALWVRLYMPWYSNPRSSFGNAVGWVGMPKGNAQTMAEQLSADEGKLGKAIERVRELYAEIKTPAKRDVNHKELMTFFYNFPKSAQMKEIIKDVVDIQNQKGLPDNAWSLNIPYLTQAYENNQKVYCGRTIKDKLHFFNHYGSWSWITNAATISGEGTTQQPATIRNFVSGKTELRRFPTSAFSEREKEALADEGMREGRTVAGTHIEESDFPYSDTLYDFTPHPVSEILAKWLRIGGTGGIAADVIALWYAFTPEAGLPYVYQGEQYGEKSSTSNGNTENDFCAAAKLLKAMVGFYMTTNAYSVFEVLIGTAPWFYKTPFDIGKLKGFTVEAFLNQQCGNSLLRTENAHLASSAAGMAALMAKQFNAERNGP